MTRALRISVALCVTAALSLWFVVADAMVGHAIPNDETCVSRNEADGTRVGETRRHLRERVAVDWTELWEAEGVRDYRTCSAGSTVFRVKYDVAGDEVDARSPVKRAWWGDCEGANCHWIVVSWWLPR